MVGATGPGALEERRDWRRVALIAVPWALASVLGVLGVLGTHGARGTSPHHPSAHATQVAAAPSPDTSARPRRDDPTVTPGRTPATASATPSALAAEVELAVLATARAALGAAGLRGAGAAADRWTVHARVAAVEAVTAEHVVATVHGLVIEHREDVWHGPQPAAVAVLVRTGADPGVVGQAWPLAPPALATATPELRSLTEVDPSVVAPLEDAGWAIDEITAVETSEDALLRIAVHGTPPARRHAADHVVWLLDAPGGPRLLPLQPPPVTEELP